MYKFLAICFYTAKFLVVIELTLHFSTIGCASTLGEKLIDDSFVEWLPLKFHPVLIIADDKSNIKDTLYDFGEKSNLIDDLSGKNYCSSPRFLRIMEGATIPQTCSNFCKNVILPDWYPTNSVPVAVCGVNHDQKKKRQPPDLPFTASKIVKPSSDLPFPGFNSSKTHSVVSTTEIISANDLLRLFHNRLLRRENPCFPTVSLEECQAEFLIMVHYHKGDGTVICQWVYDPECILMKGDLFNPSDHNHLLKGKKGSTKVGFYPVDGEKALCFKEKPKYPFFERAVCLLNQTIFGEEDDGIPNSETILINGYPFTVSCYVDGPDFEDVIKNMRLDTACNSDFIANLHHMKVLAMVSSPEDGRAQNYILRKVDDLDGHPVYRIVSIDNEHSLIKSSPHPSKKYPDVTIRPHSAVYCFGEKNPNYDALKATLFTQTPHSICKNWDSKMGLERQYHLEISKCAKGVGSFFVEIEEVVCLQIESCLEEIYCGLREGGTLEQIFHRVNPGLFTFYQNLGTPVTPPNTRGHCVLPSSSLRKAAAAVSRIDGSRLEDSATPLSACGLHDDYFGYSPVDPFMHVVSRYADSPLPACA